MGKFTAIRCWHITEAVVEPSAVVLAKHSFTVIKKSILKQGYRAFAIEERTELEAQDWYRSFLLGEEVRFYIDGTGVYRLANCDLADNELYFERLRVPIGYKPWIFYSWQSDFNPSRTKIGKALKTVVGKINDDANPRQPLEIVESTRPEDGSDDIAGAIRRNLDRCLFAVFDITNVAAVNDGKKEVKRYPNANVVYEMSYALATKRPEQILLLKHARSDAGPDAVPFDFEHNRRVDFSKPTKLTSDVDRILRDYLGRLNFMSVGAIDESA